MICSKCMRDVLGGDGHDGCKSEPTEWAYSQACKALAHWRKEAARLGKKYREAPRQMKPSKT